VFEFLFGAGSLAFAIYSWVVNGRRDTNHRIALALTARSVEVATRLDAASFSRSQKALDALLPAIGRLEDAALEARAAWGTGVARPAFDLINYASIFASVFQSVLATESVDKPALYLRLEATYGSVGVLWFTALAGTSIEPERAAAAERIDRHVTSMLANVEALTEPHLGRSRADQDEVARPEVSAAAELERIAESAEQRRLGPG
jgi:hypothetical protein